jgi:hypothetical protein
MAKAMKVNSDFYSFRSGVTNHLIQKNLNLSVIKVLKTDLVIDKDKGNHSKHVSKAKSFPLLSLNASPVNTETKGTVIIYGDAIPNLLLEPSEETDKEFIFVSSYNAKSNEWASNIEELEKAFNSLDSKPTEIKESSFKGMTLVEAQAQAVKLGVPGGDAYKADSIPKLEAELKLLVPA